MLAATDAGRLRRVQAATPPGGRPRGGETRVAGTAGGSAVATPDAAPSVTSLIASGVVGMIVVACVLINELNPGLQNLGGWCNPL